MMLSIYAKFNKHKIYSNQIPIGKQFMVIGKSDRIIALMLRNNAIF